MLGLVAFNLVVSPAFAQDEPGGPIVEKETPAIPHEVATATGARDATVSKTATSTDATLEPDWSQPPPAPACAPRTNVLYERGFGALADDRAEEAREIFDEVIRICPTHRAAPEMRRLADAIADRPIDSSTEVASGEEQPSLLAWGELMAFQTLHGVGQGILLCAAFGCEDARPFALAGFAGASVGAGLSIIGFKRLRYGQASAIDSGTGWGIWNGIALAVITEPDERAGMAIVSGLMAAGTLAGIGSAFLAPRNGAVSFSNSSGIWLGVLTLLIGIAAEADFQKTIMPIGMAVTNAGLVAGAIASRYLPISRGRVLLIDAGGVVGLLLGLGLAALINTELPGPLAGTLSSIGTAAGLVSTYFITSRLDEPAEEEPDESALWIGPSGRGLAVGASF